MTYTCKFCNKSGLIWKNIDGKWKLFDKSGGKHYCLKEKPKSDFDIKSFRKDAAIEKALKIFKKQLKR